MSFPYWKIYPSKAKAQGLYSVIFIRTEEKQFFFYSESIKKDINMISEK